MYVGLWFIFFRPPLVGARGGEKKNNQKPRTYTGSALKKAPTHLLFLFLFFKKVFIAFLGVSRHGGLKNSEKTFLEIFWS